ncbi:MAG: phage terminase large subunit [Beijerinckiaceae bacterium]
MVALKDPLGSTQKQHTPEEATALGTRAELSTAQTIKADFRLFLILLWRHLLNCDPNPAQLDLAWYLQHGPDRSVILAFRGFSKSWITGAYALWRLYCDSEEKVLVVSGSLGRAVATTNWCLTLIMSWSLLAHLKPKPTDRQSSKAFDVGPAKPSQSPSFHALGVGGQIVGFRGTCIIPDDVETQQNSLTVTMREKNLEAVKEFDSVLVPGGVIKYLGTPHDEDSLYNHLAERGYEVRVWPALYPTQDEIKRYGLRLSPWILSELRKDPSLVGRSIMPTRFTDEDLARRRLSLGRSEFLLQFMLDTSLSDQDKYPLKYRDLMLASLDPRKGPDSVVWSDDPKQRIADIQRMGFEGDHLHAAILPDNTGYSPYDRVVGAVDNSGRGADETALVIIAELHGILFWLHLWAGKAGYDMDTLQTIAKACVRFRVQKLRVEANFGDGMFAALLQPVLQAEWAKHQTAERRRLGPTYREHLAGTEIEEVRASNQMSKEQRILSILEPVTQQHRLVVDRGVLQWDYESLSKIEGEDTRHRYAFGYQYSRLTRDKDSLKHDDRLDALAIAVADFADILGVDPAQRGEEAAKDKLEEELEKLFGEMEETELGILKPRSAGSQRAPRPFLPVSR